VTAYQPPLPAAAGFRSWKEHRDNKTGPPRCGGDPRWSHAGQHGAGRRSTCRHHAVDYLGFAQHRRTRRPEGLSLFDKYEVVASDGPDGFYLDLIRNPAFPGKVNDIAVECGNSLYQPILDRYIAGEDVPLSAVRQVWRNTTQPMCGFSTFYERFFPLVRRINEKLPPAKKLRVLACDPPIDWSKVHSPQDRIPFLDRDASIANVMKTQVLSKHRKALMLFGIGHLLHGGDSAVGRYELQYPNVTFTIVLHLGFAKDNDRLEKRMTSWPVPALAPFIGTWLGTLPSSYFILGPPDLPSDGKGYPGADGYLYVGPRDHLLSEPISARTGLDTAYIAELQTGRRCARPSRQPHAPRGDLPARAAVKRPAIRPKRPVTTAAQSSRHPTAGPWPDVSGNRPEEARHGWRRRWNAPV
jgi:hypothetical protein